MKNIICVSCKATIAIDETKLTPTKAVRCGRCKVVNYQPFQEDNPPAVAAHGATMPKPSTPPASAHATILGSRQPKATPIPPQLGWIIVHDEKTASQSFDLVMGINVIGRKADKPAHILIATEDGHMSRRHCVIEVTQMPNDEITYLLYDVAKIDRNPSLNGTFINVNRKLNNTKLPNGQFHCDEVYLRDGDTIQIGETKVVLKTPLSASSKQEAQKTVIQEPYNKTVIF
jgi:predicted Zn finger-like uncharacterized protein